MEGNIVKATTSLGICIIISAVILFVGMGRLGRSVAQAGTNAGASVRVPNDLRLNLKASSGQFNLAPVRLELTAPNGASPIKLDVTTKNQTIN